MPCTCTDEITQPFCVKGQWVKLLNETTCLCSFASKISNVPVSVCWDQVMGSQAWLSACWFLHKMKLLILTKHEWWGGGPVNFFFQTSFDMTENNKSKLTDLFGVSFFISSWRFYFFFKRWDLNLNKMMLGNSWNVNGVYNWFVLI